jgi:hypothetical protein
LPSSSTIFTELEPMSRPATLFFLPNTILFSSLLGCYPAMPGRTYTNRIGHTGL